MGWLADTAAGTVGLAMWPDAMTAIVLTMNYGPIIIRWIIFAIMTRAISVYTRGRDYEVIKGKLKQLAGQFAAVKG